MNLNLATLKLHMGSQNSSNLCITNSISLHWWGDRLKISYMSSPSGLAQIRSMLVFTFPLFIWHIGPSKIHWQEHLNLWYSSRRVSECFHFGAIGGVMFCKLNELNELIICALAGLLVETWGDDGYIPGLGRWNTHRSVTKAQSKTKN